MKYFTNAEKATRNLILNEGCFSSGMRQNKPVPHFQNKWNTSRTQTVQEPRNCVWMGVAVYFHHAYKEYCLFSPSVRRRGHHGNKSRSCRSSFPWYRPEAPGSIQGNSWGSGALSHRGGSWGRRRPRHHWPSLCLCLVGGGEHKTKLMTKLDKTKTDKWFSSPSHFSSFITV